MTDLTRLDAYGLNVIYQLAYRKLHSTETAAARVVTLSPKFCHIKPVLANLHWLRIEFKILIVTLSLIHI